MKMVKKTLFVAAVVAMLAGTTMAGDEWKDKIFEHCEWPYAKIYEYQETCVVPVFMNVGYYVEIPKCKKLQIMLDQINMSTYEGCVDFAIKTNFHLELGAKIQHVGTDLGNYKAWIKSPTDVPPTGNSSVDRTVCAKLEKTKIILADPNKKLKVAEVTILVRPVTVTGP
jgi:hypothetical protein